MIDDVFYEQPQTKFSSLVNSNMTSLQDITHEKCKNWVGKLGKISSKRNIGNQPKSIEVAVRPLAY